MDFDSELTKNWYDEPAEEQYEHIKEVVETIKNNQQWRQDQNLIFAKYYLNRDFASLGPSGMTNPSSVMRRDNSMTFNVVKMAVDAIAAKVAKEKPRVFFLTSEGNFDQQERAKNLTKYVDACFSENKVYAEAHKVFLDMCIYGTGVFHVFPNPDSKTVTIERVLIQDILVDEIEATDGKPLQIHHRRLMPKSRVKKMFPEHADLIQACDKADHKDITLADRIEVRESWKLPSLPGGDDGMHTISCDTCTLFSQPYTKNHFPFAFIRWSEPLMGFYGESLVYEIQDIQDALTRILSSIIEGQTIMAVPRWFIPSATKIVEDEINDVIGAMIRYEGPTPPSAATAEGAAPELYSFYRELFDKAFEVAGVSALSATSRMPAGMESGKAMMVYSDIETERFNLIGQAYQELFMDLGDLIIDSAKELYGKSRRSKVSIKSDKFFGQVFWHDIDMNRDKYELSRYPTNLLTKEPAGQIQSVIDMVKAGMVSGPESMALLDFPDTGHFYKRATAKLRIAEKVVNNILMHGKYIAPDDFMDLDLLATTAQEAYLDAMVDEDIPEENLELLRTFMDAIKDKLVPPPAPAPAAMPPTAGPPPGPPLAKPEPLPTSDMLSQATAA